MIGVDVIGMIVIIVVGLTSAAAAVGVIGVG